MRSESWKAEILDWLSELGLDHYGESFIENDVDCSTLMELHDGDLRELGVSLGHRKIITKAITDLRNSLEHRGSGDEAVDAALGQDAQLTITDRDSSTFSTAERRQLTVMFVDLVGSTDLSVRLDPEDSER